MHFCNVTKLYKRQTDRWTDEKHFAASTLTTLKKPFIMHSFGKHHSTHWMHSSFYMFYVLLFCYQFISVHKCIRSLVHEVVSTLEQLPLSICVAELRHGVDLHLWGCVHVNVWASANLITAVVNLCFLSKTPTIFVYHYLYMFVCVWQCGVCGEALSEGKAEIFREVAKAMARAGRQRTARWQRTNKQVIKTRPS